MDIHMKGCSCEYLAHTGCTRHTAQPDGLHKLQDLLCSVSTSAYKSMSASPSFLPAVVSILDIEK